MHDATTPSDRTRVRTDLAAGTLRPRRRRVDARGAAMAGAGAEPDAVAVAGRRSSADEPGWEMIVFVEAAPVGSVLDLQLRCEQARVLLELATLSAQLKEHGKGD